jgi:SAM-dependent methyltransferase
VDRFWNGIAKSRLVESSFARTGGLALLVIMDHLVHPGSWILDFGAGDGDMVKAMCERGLQAAAYEPSEGRMENLRANLQDVPGFLGVFGPQDEAGFDVVTMTEVLEHVLDEQMDGCLKRLASLVKPGGLLVVTTPNNEDLELNMAYCPVSNVLYHRWQHQRSFTPDTLRDLLAGYGFREVVTHKIQFRPDLFYPYDRCWGQNLPQSEWPDHMRSIRANRPTSVSSESNIVCICRRMD